MEVCDFVDVSQHGEAGILEALVQPDWPRYLVDVGAHDGRSLSNSFPFLQTGWSGTLIEPLPSAFERLDALYADRPDVHRVQAACSDKDGDMRLQQGADGPSPMTSALTSTTGIPVTVRTLTNLLAEHHAPRDFSLLLVDAEGHDHAVLQGLDFDRYRPRVIVTEDDVANADQHAGKYALLEERRYSLYTVVAATNSIWVDSAHATHTEPLTPEQAIRTISRPALEARCAELERSRDEIWQRLTTIETSRSWRLTRPLRDVTRKLRGR